MKKILFFLAALVLIPASQATAQFIDTSSLYNYMKVETQQLCEDTGGYWNECTKNACQKAKQALPNSISCSQECGPSACEWPQSAKGPYSKTVCEDNGGWWNTCPMNECQKNGGTNCGVNCGKAVCEFTPPPSSEEQCSNRGGVVVQCPRPIECDKNNAEVCIEVCGKTRCRLFPETGNPDTKKACEALGGWWNINESKIGNSTKGSCELILREDTLEEEFVEQLPENMNMEKEECIENEDYVWEKCPGDICNEGETPMCVELTAEKCDQHFGIWNEDDNKCVFEVDGIPVTKKGCYKNGYRGFEWDQENQECKLYTEESCEEKNGKWEPNEEYLCRIYPKPAFIDTRDYMYQDALFYVKEKNIMTGYENKTFKPNASINRAELMKIVIEAKFPGEANGENCFDDVTNEWYSPYVCLGKEKGIVNGNSDGTFQPESRVTWVEALKIVLETYRSDLEDKSYTFKKTSNPWYKTYTEFADRVGFTLKEVKFNSQFMKRGEMAELIYRVNNI